MNDLTTAYGPFKTAPLSHQADALAASVRKWSFALLMEQGTGKTWVTLITAAILYRKKVIDVLVVFAPNDVHAQWVLEQIPAHLPTDIKRGVTIIWGTKRKSCIDKIKQLTKTAQPGLAVLVFNHESLTGNTLLPLLKALFKARNVMCVLDESHEFSNPKASRTRRATILAPLAKVRRILSGTASAQGPFALFSQYKFLDERIIGIDSYTVFRHRYAEYTKEMFTAKNRFNADGSRKLVEYESLVGYRNLQQLQDRIAPFSFRVRKDDVLGLPPKMYEKRFAAMTKIQRDTYEAIKADGIALLRRVELGSPLSFIPLQGLEASELADLLVNKDANASLVSARIKLTILMRLRQVVGGFVKDESGIVQQLDASPTPRQVSTARLVEGATGVGGKCIVWAQFRSEIEFLAKYLQQNTSATCAKLYGGDSKSERANTIAQFKDPKGSVNTLVANTVSGGTGHNFAVANTMVYYSNDFRVVKRLQSEDRSHRIGLKGTLSIYDFESDAPIDAKIRAAHQRGRDFSDGILNWTADDFEVNL